VTVPGSSTSPPSLEISPSMPLDEAATVVSATLGRVPGIRRYAEMRLEELANRGPRMARAMWQGVPPRLRAELGSETIGSVLARGRRGE